MLFLLPCIAFSQTGIENGTYISDLGDIIIRNDSVISKQATYYVYFYSNKHNQLKPYIIRSYTSEDNMNKLTVTFVNGVARHLMFQYNGDQMETPSVMFLKDNE